MKLLKKNTYPRKLNQNFVGSIGFLTLSIYLSIIVANANIAPTILFQPPLEEEQPESTEGLASRQNKECAEDLRGPRQLKFFSDRDNASHADREVSRFQPDRLNLAAIVPDSNYGLTVAERPNFWVYLPKTSAREAILSIKEEGIKAHWQQSISLTGEAGITGIKLVDDAPALEIGKNYQWTVILVCGSKPHPNDSMVTARIKRVDESEIRGDSCTAPIELEKVAWYAKQGIWYDALDSLIEAKKPSLYNWNDIWAKYLQSVGLAEIANEPIIIDYLGANDPSTLQ